MTINPPEPATPKKSRRATIVTGVVALVVGVIIGAASAGGGSPAPTAAAPGPTVTATVEVATPAETVTVTPDAPPAVTPAATTTCADAREAFLTGSPADIDRALKALQADKGADQTAREYANFYLTRDKGDPDMQTLDKGLIQTACGVFE